MFFYIPSPETPETHRNPTLARPRYGVCRLAFEVAAAGDWTNTFEIDVLMQRHLQPLGSGTTEARAWRKAAWRWVMKHIPYAPCMEYLPTFPPKMAQM